MWRTAQNVLRTLVEGKPYPTLTLGSDRFLDIFPKKPPSWHLEQEYIFHMMSLAHSLGVTGFDLSVYGNVVPAFARLKDKYGEDVIGIGDPNWRCGYKLGDTHLMDIRDRVIRTLVEKCMNSEHHALIEKLQGKFRTFWFGFDHSAEPLSPDEIRSIHIDEKEWLQRLDRLQPLADFCVVGADYADWMPLLGRIDLLNWQIESVRARRIIPISVCHWTSISLPFLDRLDVAGHWTIGNLEAMYLSTPSALEVIRTASKPVTCFRILRGISRPEGIESALRWLRNEVGVRSVVVGVDNEQEAEYTIPLAAKILGS